MSTEAEMVLAAALGLPEVDRAALIEALLSSLETAPLPTIDALWAAEVEDRLAAYERGELAAVPAAEVFASASAMLAR